MIDDVLINKIVMLERCLKRVAEEYAGQKTNLFDNITKQDSILLNLQRACEISIDLAMHIVRKQKLGIPQTSREAFDLLAGKHLISQELSESLKNMVGFRNVAIHEYQKLNLDIVQSIIEVRLSDFLVFAENVKNIPS